LQCRDWERTDKPVVVETSCDELAIDKSVDRAIKCRVPPSRRFADYLVDRASRWLDHFSGW